MKIWAVKYPNIFLEDVDHSSILATTFTRKAAAKLTTRILSWGDEIRQALQKDQQFQDIHPHLRRLDFNQIITGTMDSISNDILKMQTSKEIQMKLIEELIKGGNLCL